jgi:hypothetical protein
MSWAVIKLVSLCRALMPDFGKADGKLQRPSQPIGARDLAELSEFRD